MSVYSADTAKNNSPYKLRCGRAAPPTSKKASEEVIPDSEEERLRNSEGTEHNSPGMIFMNSKESDVIEISSDDDFRETFRPRSEVKTTFDDDPFLDSPQTLDALSKRRLSQSESDSDESVLQKLMIPRSNRARRVILSSSESETGTSEPHTGHLQDVIELTDSSSPEHAPPPEAKLKLKQKINNLIPLISPSSVFLQPYTVNDDDGRESSTDDAILTLNEPRSSRKPHPRPGLSTIEGRVVPGFSETLIADRTPPQTPALPRIQSDQLHHEMLSPAASPVKQKTKAISNDSIPSTAAGSSATRTPKKGRISKKALALAEQQRREAYAQELFDELNKIVFHSKLPLGTALVWNNRLQTTAGKAKWHRSRDNVETNSIELATKVLDSEERIRNTLSHEMCHLACWAIDRDPKEGHGSIWKGWAERVMNKRPDIVITTKHAYEIVYKFQWECNKCSKIYGRHSKSIDPVKSICGVCREGDLIPLFPVRQRPPQTPKTKADSRMAAGKSRDSPTSVTRVLKPSTPSHLGGTNRADPDPATVLNECDINIEGLVCKLSFIDLTQD